MRSCVILAAAALAACGSGDKVDMKDASVNDVAKGMRKADAGEGFVNPGQWKQTVTLVEMTAPGMPPQIAEAMKRQTGTSQLNTVCLTPEQAKRPREDFFTGAEKNCRYEHFKWGGGKVDLKLVCTEAQGSRTMELTGDYKPDSYRMAMTAKTDGGPPERAMTMRMRVDAERTGECSAKKG